ncbi:DUF1642 domain-containing protein [Jeotgalibaca porci]|uniref:DUF1642 domain-containing protein n=1 Tax=Jeotgalibaca porci TaxID=1868793 RepID=UPI0035A051D6
MSKDKSWLLEKHRECIQSPETGEKMFDLGYELALDDMLVYINQLDEPEKPVIPDFMAYWIEENEYLTLMYIGFELFSNRIKDKEVNTWIRNNQEQFCRAFLAWPNVEVEKEKKYIIKFAPSVFGTSTYGSIGTQNGKKIMQSVYGSQEGIIIPNQYTRREIEEVGSKYMIFAEEVTE